MSEIHLDDLQHVVIDGVTVGDVASAMANYPAMIADIQSSLELWFAAQLQSVRDAAATVVTAAEVERDKAKADLVAMTADRDANANDNAQLRQLTSMYLLNQEAAKEAMRQMHRTMWESQRDACIAKIAELDATPS